MTQMLGRSLVMLACIAASVLQARAQDPPPAAAVTQLPLPLPPATKLEAFQPALGSILTIGYDELGRVEGVSVDVREMHDGMGASVRGLVVRVVENERHAEVSFVDEDEIPQLLEGFDALLDVRSNPTEFKNFEVRYATKGELALSAFNTPSGNVLFAVQVGRPLTARRSGLTVSEMLRLRAMFGTAAQKLNVKSAAR